MSSVAGAAGHATMDDIHEYLSPEKDEQANAGRDANIKVFARIRPVANTKERTATHSVSSDGKTLTFSAPRDPSLGWVSEGACVFMKTNDVGFVFVCRYINNMQETFRYKFSGVFDQPTTQDQVFNTVGRKVRHKQRVQSMVPWSWHSLLYSARCRC